MAESFIQASFDSAVAYSLATLASPHLTLKEEQLQSVKAVYEGKDVFVRLPTGFGKSLCYQVLPFVFDHKLGLIGSGSSSAVLIISPLLSLMVDQVQSLRSRGAKSSIITSGPGIVADLVATDSSFMSDSLLFCAPESLVKNRWREVLDKPSVSSRIVAVVVDEAHCVSKWSKEFRPSFGHIAEIRALVPPGTPYMALTATATKSVHSEVIRCLEMEKCVQISLSPDRPNIFYEVSARTSIELDLAWLMLSLRDNVQKTPRVIVYCQSLDMCSSLYANFLFELGDISYYPAGVAHLSENRLFGMFHACTPQHNKDIILQSLLKSDGVVRVVFATIALGMGVNLQDVNTIVHYGAPRSIEDYFQESGRGGRSGKNARSVIYWKPSDCKIRKEPSTPQHHEAIAVRQYLENMSSCRRQWLLKYFLPGLGYESSRCCDVCL